MSINPFKKNEAFRFQWDGFINKSQIRIKESENKIEIQMISQNIFKQAYNKIIKSNLINKFFGKITPKKPIVDSTIVLNKEMKLQQTCDKLFASVLTHKIKENLQKIHKQLDNSLKNDHLKPFTPKIRQLISESNQALKLSHEKGNSFDFDFGKKFLYLANAYTNISLKGANKWNSAELLTKNEILNYAADYPDNSQKSIEKFAEDTTGKTLEELHIEKFAVQILGLAALKLSIKAVQPGLTSGASGELVYMIRDKKSKKLLCIVKIKTPEAITKEINALRLMKKQNMKNCHFPEVMGIGICKTHIGIQSALFAQSPAKGLSIDKYIETAGKSSGTERGNHIKTLTKAIQSMAKGMAELHNQKNKKDEKYFETYQTIIIQNIDRLLDNPLFKSLPLAEMKKQLSLKPSFEAMTTFAHGDFHPGNVFYSEDNSFLTLIDNDGVLDSLDLETLNPKGTASYDFSLCYQWLIVLGSMNGLTQNETQSLVEIFENQYISSRKIDDKDHLKQEIEFMKTFIAIRYIADITDVLTMPHHSWYKSIGKEHLEGLRNLLKSRISNFN